jgi:hypothetical protein
MRCHSPVSQCQLIEFRCLIFIVYSNIELQLCSCGFLPNPICCVNDSFSFYSLALCPLRTPCQDGYTLRNLIYWRIHNLFNALHHILLGKLRNFYLFNESHPVVLYQSNSVIFSLQIQQFVII